MAEYIDRKSLIDEFDRLGLGEHSFDERVFSDGVRTIIAGIPAADVAPVVHSYWEHKITSYGEIVSSCHNCKYPVSHFWGLTNYCPNCGARMDGDSDALD